MTIPDASWEECSACGERVLSLELEGTLRDEQYRRCGLLTPCEIAAVRGRTGLTQVQMAHLLGIGAKTYARWEAGASLHNRSSDNLIRLVDRHADLFAQLDAQRSPERKRLVAEYIKSLGDRAESDASAVAAHGEELDPKAAGKLRQVLLEIAESRQEARC